MTAPIVAPSFWRSRPARTAGIFIGIATVQGVAIVFGIWARWRIFDWGNG